MRLFAVAAVAAMVAAAGIAHADPAPPPGPYVIPGPSGPVVGGLSTLPPRCAVQPRACQLTWNPNTGTWERGDTN
jgi:hypothetical protein